MSSAQWSEVRGQRPEVREQRPQTTDCGTTGPGRRRKRKSGSSSHNSDGNLGLSMPFPVAHPAALQNLAARRRVHGKSWTCLTPRAQLATAGATRPKNEAGLGDRPDCRDDIKTLTGVAIMLRGSCAASAGCSPQTAAAVMRPRASSWAPGSPDPGFRPLTSAGRSPPCCTAT
jgi:hypothetical protein